MQSGERYRELVLKHGDERRVLTNVIVRAFTTADTDKHCPSCTCFDADPERWEAETADGQVVGFMPERVASAS